MKSPFKFLDSYTKDDRDIFFGRDREIEELYQRVFDSKLLLVYGVSGTGKSSLIHCGLANKFRETDWLPLVIRRGGNMIESMGASIKSASITPQESNLANPADFKKGVRSLYLDHYKPVFFIFDQFEELFIFGNKDERRQFVHIVKSLIESNLQCRLIFVMREEYMAGVTEFEKYIPTFFSNRVRIEKISHINALEAIKEPCKVFNISLEEGFAETLLEKLSPDAADVELTYLQVFLDKIFCMAGGEKGSDTASGQLSFTILLLEKAGKVSDLLGSFLEEQIKDLEEPETGLTILKTFVSIKGTKKQLTHKEVIESSRSLGKDIAEETITVHLQKFVNLRILREKDENDKYELRHDSLASKIYEKITLVEKELLEIRDFIETAFGNYNKRNVLLNDKDLAYISRYEKSLFLNSELNAFINKSKQTAVARVKVFRIITTIASIVFLIIICGIGYYSLRSSSEVKSKNLAIESLLMKNDYPADAWKMASDAYAIKKTPVTVKALFESFYNLLDKKVYSDTLGNQFSPQKEIFDFTECKAEILFARFSSDGKLIYGFLADSTIKIWDSKGQEIRSFNRISSPLISVKLSDNNKFVGALDKDSTIHIWKIEGTEILRIKAYYNKINPDNVFNFSRDGKWYACIIANNKVVIYNTSGEIIQTLSGHMAAVTCANFSPDSKFIATTSMDNTIIIWYYNKKKSVFEEYTKLIGHKNIVWSARFSMNSNYILTASADTSCKIWNLNGKIIDDRKFTSIYVQVESKVKFCDATFNNDDNVIIYTKYKTINRCDSSIYGNSVKNPEIIYEMDCRINEGSTNYPGSAELFSSYWLQLASTDSTRKSIFSKIDVNKSVEYLAYTFSDDLNSIYFSGTGDVFKLFIFAGKQQQFSPDGNYLLAVNNKYLNLYPSTEKELLRLVNDQKIFGKLKSSKKVYDKWYNFN
jgi:WD40 repeat protein